MMENVPRKEKQFRNFTVNSLKLKGGSAEKTKDEIWKHLVKVREDEKQKREEAQKKQQQSSSSSQQAAAKDDTKKEAVPTSVSDDDKSSKEEGSAKEDKEPSSSSSSSMPSEKTVTKAVKKALKKAPNKSLNFKALRKQVQEALALKTKSDSAKREWKKLLKQCVDANSKKMVVDGKLVTLK